jgi:hypothetical protein
MRLFSFHAIAAALLLGAAAAPAPAGDSWPSFQNGGNTSDAKDLPLHWSPEQGIAWSVELRGYGQSTPVLWKDRVYVTSVEGDEKEQAHVAAYDAASGKPIWSRSFDAAVRLKYGGTGPAFEKVTSNPLLTNEVEAASPAQESSGAAQPSAGIADQLDPVVYAAAAIDSRIFIRTGTKLVCVRRGR